MPHFNSVGTVDHPIRRCASPASMLMVCVAAWLVAAPGIARAQGGYSVQAIREPAPAADSLRSLLEDTGTRLTGPDGKIVCELWWARSVSLRPDASKSASIGYAAIEPGTLLGVVHFPTENEDSRDQKLRPGWYTLRYATMPSDEAHKGASPHPDFALLIPAAFDGTPGQPPKPEMLLRLSRKASLTPHPAVISLIPANAAYRTLPAAVADDAGNCAVQAKLHGKAPGSKAESEFTLSILLVTPLKDNGTS
jgi:hypothetical protein